MWWVQDQYHYPTYSSMNRALFQNDRYGDMTVHETATPPVWGFPRTLYNFVHAPEEAGSVWAFQHRSESYAGAGTVNSTKPDLTPFGVYGYNLSATVHGVTNEIGDVEPFAVPYAPRDVQCRYDQSAGAARRAARHAA